MKRTYQIAGVAVIVLAFVAVGRHHASADGTASPADTRITETVSGGPTPKQAMDLSQKGLTAVEDAHLARQAINDGKLDSAKELLAESRDLLSQVRKEDRPVIVKTSVEQGRKRVEHEKMHEVLDLIPIASTLKVVEGFVPSANTVHSAADTGKTAANGSGSPKTASSSQQKTASPQQPTNQQQTAKADQAALQAKQDAIAKAREHLRNGDREAAAKALKLADLALVAREVSMPMADTSAHVDTAISLLDQGKPHEANLELKKLQDELVVSTTVVGEPLPGKVSSSAPAAPSRHG